MLKISQLFIYPIKSLRGISLSSSMVTDRGLQYDRRWMLVDGNNCFLTLREYPKMTLLNVELHPDGLRIESLEKAGRNFRMFFHVGEDKDLEPVTIWNAAVEAKRVGQEADEWFSEMLGGHCKLVFMPEQTMRPVDTTSGYSPKGKFVSFADAYPFMMLSEASMHDLNSRMKIPQTINRFRPNVVFSGAFPYQEDTMEDFTIGDIHFTGLENCARCPIPTIDPETGVFSADKEPLRTLSKYRTQNKNIEFGRNVVHGGTGIISVGDEIRLLEKSDTPKSILNTKTAQVKIQ
jgi:uncharacterized protein